MNRAGVRAFFLVLACLAWSLSRAGVKGEGSYRETAVKNGGTVSGAVRLEGIIPRDATEPVTKDPDYCGKMKVSPRLIAGKNGAVKNAVVSLEQIAEGKKWNAPAIALLHQRKCEYDPHVLVLGPHTELDIVNDDPILHNVHGYEQRESLRSVFNIAQPLKGQKTRIAPERLSDGEIRATCDAGHPWMNAYIVRLEHPYVALTGEDGKFEIRDIPPGIYTLRMWHEGVTTKPSRVGSGTPPVVEQPYEASRQVSVEPNGHLKVDFTFALRSAFVSN